MITVAMSVSFLVVVNRTARHYEQNIPETSIIHGLWLQSNALYFQPFPDGQGFNHVVEVVQTFFAQFAGDLLGGLTYLVFFIERVWNMIFGPSESELLQIQIKLQEQELARLSGVQSTSAQFLQALQIAVQKSPELASAVAQGILKLTEEAPQVQDARVSLEQELAMIDTVLTALTEKIRTLSEQPNRVAKIEQFKKLMQAQIEQNAAAVDQVPQLLEDNDQVEEEYTLAADQLERAGEKVTLSVSSMVRSLVEILAPNMGDDFEHLDLLGGSHASTKLVNDAIV